MPSSSKRSFEEFSGGCKMVVDGHVGESDGRSYIWEFCACGSGSKDSPQYMRISNHPWGEGFSESVMPQSSERPIEDKKNQIHVLKKCKMVVDRHLGKSSDKSSTLNCRACDSRSQKSTKSFAVDYRMCASCEFPTIRFSVTGSHLGEPNHGCLEMLQLIAQKIAPETDVQISPRKGQGFAVNWSELDVDVLVRIAENHLPLPDDFVMFSSVCRSWHRAAAACNLLKLNKKWIHNQIPWVMLTDGKVGPRKGGYSESLYVLPKVLNDIEEFVNGTGIMSVRTINSSRCVLSLRSNKWFVIKCLEGYGRVCWGSAHGWIVTAGGDGIMFMFNPFTESRVGLPSFGTFRWRWDNEDEVRRDCFVTKAVVLSVGGDDDAQTSGDGVENLRIVVFYGNDHVAIVKPGNRRWVEIEGVEQTRCSLMDVTYDSKLGLIFVDNCGRLFCCDVPEKEESPLLKWFQPPPNGDDIHGYHTGGYYCRTYIVKCGADLFVVYRCIVIDDGSEDAHDLKYQGLFFAEYYMTSHFMVFKYSIDLNTWERCWEMKDIALFVGNNTSMWAREPCDGCIYFNDDLRRFYSDTKYKLGGHDSGVCKVNPFKAFRSSIDRCEYGGNDNRSGYCCPFFFKPSICVSKCLN